MLIASYNKNELGDILVVIAGADQPQVEHHFDDVVEVVSEDGQELLGVNFFNASQLLPELTDENGQVHLTDNQVVTLNAHLKHVGATHQLQLDHDSKFVLGYVKQLEDHPRSDHLHITKTLVNNDQTLQIVSGSPNIAADILVVVAKVGAMMPSGEIIWPGQLRGVSSDGMICSGRELHIKNAPNRPGALILPTDFGQVGDAFDFDKAQTLFD